MKKKNVQAMLTGMAVMMSVMLPNFIGSSSGERADRICKCR